MIISKKVFYLIFGLMSSITSATHFSEEGNYPPSLKELSKEQIRIRFREVEKEFNKFNVIDEYVYDDFDGLKKELEMLSLDEFYFLLSMLSKVFKCRNRDSELNYIIGNIKRFNIHTNASASINIGSKEIDLQEAISSIFLINVSFQSLDGNQKEIKLHPFIRNELKIYGNTYTLEKNDLPKEHGEASKNFYPRGGRSHIIIKLIRNEDLDIQESDFSPRKYFYTILKQDMYELLKEKLINAELNEECIESIYLFSPNKIKMLLEISSNSKKGKKNIKHLISSTLKNYIHLNTLI